MYRMHMDLVLGKRLFTIGAVGNPCRYVLFETPSTSKLLGPSLSSTKKAIDVFNVAL